MKQSNNYRVPSSYTMQQMSKKFRKTWVQDLKLSPVFQTLAWALPLSSQLQEKCLIFTVYRGLQIIQTVLTLFHFLSCILPTLKHGTPNFCTYAQRGSTSLLFHSDMMSTEVWCLCGMYPQISWKISDIIQPSIMCLVMKIYLGLCAQDQHCCSSQYGFYPILLFILVPLMLTERIKHTLTVSFSFYFCFLP